MIQQNNKPIWISHRGYCKKYVENTVNSFDEAIRLGFRYLETDLRITADHHLLLAHDTCFQRLGGPSTNIIDMKRSDIQKIDLKQGAKILFFEDFIQRYSSCHWVFDIKPENGEKTLQQLIKWMRAHKKHKQILQPNCA